MTSIKVFVILAISCFLLTGFKPPNVRDLVTAPAYKVTINANEEGSYINPLLMGFNIVYPFEKDSEWKAGDGKIPTLLKGIDTRVLRYPGGTVTTFYHWEQPTGQGWNDTLDPNFDKSKNTSPSEMMDIDEYLSMTQK